MFRRNPFAKGTPIHSQGEGSLHPTIPEDKQPPSTPIPERPSLFVTDSRQDPNEPVSASWTSQAAAYDINPKYTTANQSYTHRRRRSSVITNLIAGSNDLYQPTYQDWREGVASPESLRPRTQSWSLFGRRTNPHYETGRQGGFKCGQVTKILAVLFLLVSLILSGLWLFGGPMPPLTVDNLKVLDWTFNTANRQWGNWQIEGAMPGKKLAQVKRWMPSSMRRAAVPLNEEGPSESVQMSQVLASIVTTVSINPDLKSFGVETLERRTRKAQSTSFSATRLMSPSAPMSASVSTSITGGPAPTAATVLDEPVSSRDASTTFTTGEPATEASEEVEVDDAETQAHQRRSEAMWKKIC